jgi:signal recognition particle subunit SRP54
MVMDNLGESLRGALKKIANAGFVDPALIKDVTRDIQRALIQSDVNVRLVLELSKRIEKRALEEKPAAGASNREHVIRIVHDELVSLLGPQREVPLKKQTIMMVGLYGQGKTTTTGKLAKYFSTKGLKVALIAADVHRPAAMDQLEQIAKQVNVPVHIERGEKDAVKIVRNGLAEFRPRYDVVIVDTAGRHKLDDDLIVEMKHIFQAAQPDEKFLVIDAAVGQQGGPQAKAFHDAVQVTGVIVTKLDGTAKGGGAMSAVAATQAPIVFIGTGEHLDEMEKFDATRFISRLLGMGDLQSLLEKAQEAVEGGEDDAEAMARKIMTGKFTLNDMYAQMEMLGKMGPLKKVLGMLPGGMGAKMKDADVEKQQKQLKKFRVMMDSMTEEELENPGLIKSSRIQRIARGAGVEPKDVKELINYYNKSKAMMKQFAGNRRMQRKLMQQLDFGGGFPGG